MEAATPAIRFELIGPVPATAPVGADVVVRVRVSCPAARDRRGMAVTVITPDDTTTTYPLTTFDGKGCETDEIALRAPLSVGEHAWRMFLPPHELGGTAFESSGLAFSIRTVAHQTSLAVWGFPSPVTEGERFGVTVGAKSSGNHDLQGRQVEICDDDGAVIASGILGETPWPGTDALYWTEIELTAPSAPGSLSLLARFSAAELEMPHDDASSPFSIVVVPPPEHTLTIKVIAADGAGPIEDAQIRLGVYRGATDATGHAQIPLCKGRYDLEVWKAGYEAPLSAVDIRDDASVQVEMLAVPEEDPDARWKM